LSRPNRATGFQSNWRFKKRGGARQQEFAPDHRLKFGKSYEEIEKPAEQQSRIVGGLGFAREISTIFCPLAPSWLKKAWRAEATAMTTNRLPGVPAVAGVRRRSREGGRKRWRGWPGRR
jgi:hypothetical protein